MHKTDKLNDNLVLKKATNTAIQTELQRQIFIIQSFKTSGD